MGQQSHSASLRGLRGNLTNDGSANYLYDRANPAHSGQGYGRLISTTLGGVTTQFSYNGDGVRLKQIVAGTLTTGAGRWGDYWVCSNAHAWSPDGWQLAYVQQGLVVS